MRTLFILLTLALLAPGIAQAAPVSRVVAVVNGEMISSFDLEKIVNSELMSMRIDPKSPANAAQVNEVTKQVLESLVLEKIMAQEAARQGIVLEAAEVDAAVENFIKNSQLSRDEFLKQSERQGISLETLRHRVEMSMLNQQLINRMVLSKVVVTDAEINEYFQQNYQGSGGYQSGNLHIALIIYPAGEDAAAWANKISKGSQSFGEVARQVSIGPNPEGGGDLGFMESADMAPALREAVATLKKGEVSGLFEMSLNKAQAQLLEAGASEQGSSSAPVLDPSTAAQIEQSLREPRLEARFAEYQEQLRKKAIVEIRL